MKGGKNVCFIVVDVHYDKSFRAFQYQCLAGLVVKTPAFHPRDPGSIPAPGITFFIHFSSSLNT